MTRTSTVSHSTAPIYPAYCHHLSPTNSGQIWCPLFAADIHSLRQEPGYDGQNVYFHLNHPIKFVFLTALIIDVFTPGKYTVITVDDSSGESINAVFPVVLAPIDRGINPNTTTASVQENEQVACPDFGPDFVEFDSTNLDNNIGKTVKIKGTLSMFRGRMQIDLCRYWVLGDTNAEVQFWAKVIEFKKKVWGKPWVLSEEQLRMCREEVEREHIREEQERICREQVGRRERREERREERRGERREDKRRQAQARETGERILGNGSREPSHTNVKPAGNDRESARPKQTAEGTRQQVGSGDWICPSCGATNFRSANRTDCFRCSASRPPAESANNGAAVNNTMGPGRQVEPAGEEIIPLKFQVKPGDWTCPSCGKNNYARLTKCHKCSTLRPPPAAPENGVKNSINPAGKQVKSGEASNPKQVLPGDWACPSCQENNYARLTECYRCHTLRPPRTTPNTKFKPKPGDWTCQSCRFGNFARLKECGRCHTKRPVAGSSKGQVLSSTAPNAKFEPKPGDWTCPSCDWKNFARFRECRKCKRDRPAGL